MINRRHVMQTAHRLYRSHRAWQVGAKRDFTRKGFAHFLRQAWADLKASAAAALARAAVPASPTPTMQERIEALQYLPLRYNIGAMAEAIRAEHRIAA